MVVYQTNIVNRQMIIPEELFHPDGLLEDGEYCIYKGMNNLHMVSEEVWSQYQKKMSELPIKEESCKITIRFALTCSAVVRRVVDGKIELPEYLTKYAGIDENSEVIIYCPETRMPETHDWWKDKKIYVIEKMEK